MSDVRAALHDAVGDVLTGPDTAGTSLAVLVVAAFFLGAHVWSAHRYTAAALRVAGLLAMLTAVALGAHSRG